MWLLTAIKRRLTLPDARRWQAPPAVDDLEASKCLIDWRTGAVTFLAADAQTVVSRPCPADIPS